MTIDRTSSRTVPESDDLREHLAYEIHYLVLAATRFPHVIGREATIYQDSALLHARTLLEFSDARRHPGWWVGDLTTERPTSDTALRDWLTFINSHAAHLGQRRLRGAQWPVPRDSERLINLATFTLKRLKACGDEDASDEVALVHHLAELGLRYLDVPVESSLRVIAELIDNAWQPVRGIT